MLCKRNLSLAPPCNGVNPSLLGPFSRGRRCYSLQIMTALQLMGGRLRDPLGVRIRLFPRHMACSVSSSKVRPAAPPAAKRRPTGYLLLTPMPTSCCQARSDIVRDSDAFSRVFESTQAGDRPCKISKTSCRRLSNAGKSSCPRPAMSKLEETAPRATPISHAPLEI